MRSRLLVPALVALAACAPATGDDEPVLARIVITGATSPVILGEVPTVQLTAQGLDQNNNPFPTQFAWSSSDPTRASVSGAGLVTVAAVGAVTIRAESGSIAGSVTIDIVAPPPAPAVANVILDDVANSGDAGDLEISFDRPGNESRVTEYRVIIFKTANTARLTVADASQMPADRYHQVLPTGQNVRIRLSATLRDSDGHPILEGIEYSALVLSVAAAGMPGDNALSDESNSILVASTTVRISFVGADGVVLGDGTRTVIIDAIPLAFSVVIDQMNIAWLPAAAGLLAAIQNGTPPYQSISAALVTHDHLDHWAPAGASTLLANHPETKLLGPPQVAVGLPANPRVMPLDVPLAQAAETSVDGVRIKAYRMVHFNNFGLDFSGVQNLAFLVELGGRKILHLGDADYTAQNFAPFGFAAENIDVVIVPGATAKITAGNIALVRSLIAPDHILVGHLEAGNTEAAVKAVFGADVAVFTRSLQFVRY